MSDEIGPSSNAISDDASRALVLGSDPDRAVSVLFAPADRQPALHALYAFDLETGSVRDRISQPLPGEIRLQWWRDVIAGRSSAGSAPVATALCAAIERYDLPIDAFDRLLDARIFDLYDDPMPSRIDFEAYAGETRATVIMLAAMILDRAVAASVADIAGHAGVSDTVADTLRNAERHRRRSQIFVPGDLLEATGTSTEAWLSFPTRPAAVDAALIAYGLGHYRVVEAGYRAVPRPLRPAFLPSLLAPRRIVEHARPRPVGPLSRSWTYWRGMRGTAPKTPKVGR